MCFLIGEHTLSGAKTKRARMEKHEGSATLVVEEQLGSKKELEDCALRSLAEHVKDESTFYDGVLNFLDWLQGKVASYLIEHLRDLPVVGTWATRIGTTVSGLVFAVLRAVFAAVKLTLAAPEFWTKAHASALKAWQENEAQGLLAQTFAYSKKMAAYFLEVLKQIFERAVAAKGLTLGQEDKQEISALLDNLAL